MKLKNRFKVNKGAALADIVLAMLIIIILGGLVIGMFYKIYFNSSMITMNAIALNYAINILEETDKLPYDQVVDTINFKERFDIPDDFIVNVNINNYKNGDFIKIITLTIKYSLQNMEEEFTINKLKVREI